MATMTSRTMRQQTGRCARPAAPVRVCRPVRAQAMNDQNKEFRAEAVGASGIAAPKTPYDDYKFAPIREATVSLEFSFQSPGGQSYLTF